MDNQNIDQNMDFNQQELDNKIQKDEQELKKYTAGQIINTIMDKNKGYWQIKYVHASGHGGQNINHGNSKAQLHFDINKFYNDFDLQDKTWDDFVRVFGEKNITHDQSKLILENQETRYASKNRENVLNHLRQLLLELFKEEKERIQTEISEIENEKRLMDKKHNSEKKKMRKAVDLSDID